MTFETQDKLNFGLNHIVIYAQSTKTNKVSQIYYQ